MSVSIGVVGPAGANHKQLERALSLLLEDEDTRFVVYLGHDGAASAVVSAWPPVHDGIEASFLDRAFEAALAGSPEAIRALLNEDAAGRRQERVRCLPEPPARAVEMLDRWIVMAVHDKALLDKDDIASAHLLLYGKADGPEFHSFGTRSFFTPGRLAAGRVGRLALQPNGDLGVQALRLDGTVELEETCEASQAKLVVTG